MWKLWATTNGWHGTNTISQISNHLIVIRSWSAQARMYTQYAGCVCVLAWHWAHFSSLSPLMTFKARQPGTRKLPTVHHRSLCFTEFSFMLFGPLSILEPSIIIVVIVSMKKKYRPMLFLFRKDFSANRYDARIPDVPNDAYERGQSEKKRFFVCKQTSVRFTPNDVGWWGQTLVRMLKILLSVWSPSKVMTPPLRSRAEMGIITSPSTLQTNSFFLSCCHWEKKKARTRRDIECCGSVQSLRASKLTSDDGQCKADG